MHLYLKKRIYCWLRIMHDARFSLEKMLLKIKNYTACVYTGNFEFIPIQFESV